jgi:hypothetical protein
LDPLDGVWSGQLIGYTFDSGSRAIALTIQSTSPGNYTATLKLGEAIPPTLGSDPEVGYPMNVVPSAAPNKHFYGEGFVHSVTFFRFADSKLDLQVDLDEFWAAWCSMEPTIDLSPEAPGTYGCLPRWAPVIGTDGTCAQTDPTTHSNVPRDCAKLTLCSIFPVCGCKATGCSAGEFGLRGHATVQLDSGVMSFALSDDESDGLNGTTATLVRH